MDKPVRFFECLLPETVCNLECEYCYIIQENRRTMKLANLQYSPEHIAKALRPSRVGGKCWISICGAGETCAQPELPQIVSNLLKDGHYVNITTNGTLTKQIERILTECDSEISHLHFAFSLHYIELKKKGLIDKFFANVKMVHERGASFLVQINLCDSYMPYIDEIKSMCLERIGAYPQVALTRNEETRPMSIFSQKTDEEYFTEGEKFDSPLFRFTFKNFNVKRNEFCYAGLWSGVLNLETGILTKCYANADGSQNIFEDLSRPIHFEAVGKNCRNAYCVNSSHFMSLGVIPEINAPTYAELRNRNEANWYTQEMNQFLNHKLKESNKTYNVIDKMRLQLQKEGIRGILSKLRFYRALHAIKEKLKHTG